MEKVKVTKEQAKAIDDEIAKGISPEQFVEYHATGKGKWDNSYLNTLSLDAVIRALYIGYEVEETPEDKVREYYKELCNKGIGSDGSDQYAIGYKIGARNTVPQVLDLLNIKIEGVNA